MSRELDSIDESPILSPPTPSSTRHEIPRDSTFSRSSFDRAYPSRRTEGKSGKNRQHKITKLSLHAVSPTFLFRPRSFVAWKHHTRTRDTRDSSATRRGERRTSSVARLSSTPILADHRRAPAQPWLDSASPSRRRPRLSNARDPPRCRNAARQAERVD